MRAQEYFEQIRETVVEIERSKEMLERLLASEGFKRDGFIGRVNQACADLSTVARINYANTV